MKKTLYLSLTLLGILAFHATAWGQNIPNTFTYEKHNDFINPASQNNIFFLKDELDRGKEFKFRLAATGRYHFSNHPTGPKTVFLSGAWRLYTKWNNRLEDQGRIFLGVNGYTDKFGPTATSMLNARFAFLFMQPEKNGGNYGLSVGANVGLNRFRVFASDVFFVDGNDAFSTNLGTSNQTNLSAGLYGFVRISQSKRALKNTFFAGISWHNLVGSDEISFGQDPNLFFFNHITYTNILGGMIFDLGKFRYIELATWIKYGTNSDRISISTPMSYNFSSKFLIFKRDFWLTAASTYSSLIPEPYSAVNLKLGFGFSLNVLSNAEILDIEFAAEALSKYWQDFGSTFEVSVSYSRG